MPKKYSRIKRTDQNTTETNCRKIWYRQKTITYEQLLQNSVHADMKSEQGTIVS